ncbi:MAG: hypothetical protein KIH63_001415 [Candidatus Saccharibacteria bacterium]|nr:hypothetical protein [Candidatus Saccharibacteria bacterium]
MTVPAIVALGAALSGCGLDGERAEQTWRLEVQCPTDTDELQVINLEANGSRGVDSIDFACATSGSSDRVAPLSVEFTGAIDETLNDPYTPEVARHVLDLSVSFREGGLFGTNPAVSEISIGDAFATVHVVGALIAGSDVIRGES